MREAADRRPLLNVKLRWFLLAMILANIAGQMGYSMLSLYLIDLGANVGQVGLVFTLASSIPIVWFKFVLSSRRDARVESAAGRLDPLA